MPLTIITLSKVPNSLRGDLTKWMQEIATGVYVGNFNTKVREQLWQRVKDNIENGEATLTYHYRNEIGYHFETINTKRECIDFDGIPLVLFKQEDSFEIKTNKLGFSNAAKFRKAQKFNGSKPVKSSSSHLDYVVIDIETTGLDERNDAIIEIGAIKMTDSKIEELNHLIRVNEQLPKSIQELTGLTDDDLTEKGVPLERALDDFLDFIGDADLVGYNINFDLNFLNNALKKCSKKVLKNKRYDLLNYVKKEKMFLKNYKLDTVIKEYGIEEKVEHRALLDCRIMFALSKKVNKFLANFK